MRSSYMSSFSVIKIIYSSPGEKTLSSRAMHLRALPWILFCVTLTHVLSTEIDDVIRVHSVVMRGEGDKILSKGIIGGDTIVGVHTLENVTESFYVPRINATGNASVYADVRVEAVHRLLSNMTGSLRNLFRYICRRRPWALQISYICYPTETGTYAALRIARDGYYVVGVHLWNGTLQKDVPAGIIRDVDAEATSLFSMLTPNNGCLPWTTQFGKAYRKPSGISRAILSLCTFCV